MDARDGIVLAGMVLSLFLGYLGYRTGREARDDAHALAHEAREAQSAEARAARLHETRKDVYVEVLEYVFRTEDTVDRTEPFMTWDGAPGPPEWPSDDEIRRQNARTSAFGSPEMREKLLELKSAVQAFQGAVFVMRGERDAHHRAGQMVVLHEKVDTTRTAVRNLVKDVIDLANRELAE